MVVIILIYSVMANIYEILSHLISSVDQVQVQVEICAMILDLVIHILCIYVPMLILVFSEP